MSAEECACYPEFIRMREVEMNGRILVTTLLDSALVSAKELGPLYKMRWAIAALLADKLPRMLSFAGARDILGAFADLLRRASDDKVHTLIAIVTASIATL